MGMIKWQDLSEDDRAWLKEHYPQIAMDLIFGLPTFHSSSGREFNLDVPYEEK